MRISRLAQCLVVVSVLAGSCRAQNYDNLGNPQQQNFQSFQGPGQPQQPQAFQQNRNVNFNAQRFPQYQKPFVPITSFKNELSYDGTFSYSFTTGDGQAQQANGYLKNRGIKNIEAQVVSGSYSYTSPEGKPVSVTYIADEHGFRASGNHLPTPPPIPPEIKKSLELIARTQPVPASFQSQYQTGQYNQGFNQGGTHQQHQNFQQNQQTFQGPQGQQPPHQHHHQGQNIYQQQQPGNPQQPQGFNKFG